MRRTPTPEPYFLQTASSGVHSPEKLHELLVKMKIWESALLNHFEDRIDDADSLAMDPMWSRLMQVSTTMSRYLLSANLPSRYLLFCWRQMTCIILNITLFFYLVTNSNSKIDPTMGTTAVTNQGVRCQSNEEMKK